MSTTHNYPMPPSNDNVRVDVPSMPSVVKRVPVADTAPEQGYNSPRTSGYVTSVPTPGLVSNTK